MTYVLIWNLLQFFSHEVGLCCVQNTNFTKNRCIQIVQLKNPEKPTNAKVPTKIKLRNQSKLS